MMQRRSFIHKASFGLLLFGQSGLISGFSSEKKPFHLLAQDIISIGGFRQVSMLEYDPKVDRIIESEVNSLIKLGYSPDNSGYLISSSRKQILSVFSIQGSSPKNNLPIAVVLERSGKSWRRVHTIDVFEIQARSKAVQDLAKKSNPAIRTDSIICLPKLSNNFEHQHKDKPYFVCNTLIVNGTAKTSAQITINSQNVWSSEFSTDY